MIDIYCVVCGCALYAPYNKPIIIANEQKTKLMNKKYEWLNNVLVITKNGNVYTDGKYHPDNTYTLKNKVVINLASLDNYDDDIIINEITNENNKTKDVGIPCHKYCYYFLESIFKFTLTYKNFQIIRNKIHFPVINEFYGQYFEYGILQENPNYLWIIDSPIENKKKANYMYKIWNYILNNKKLNN